MKINTLFYTVKQGISNIFRNIWFSLASAATIAACLFLFGIFFAIIINFQHIVKTAEEGVSVTVFFEDDITDERIREIGETISKRVEVKEDGVVFVSADEAWDDFSVDYLQGYTAGFPDNPLEGIDRKSVV